MNINRRLILGMFVAVLAAISSIALLATAGWFLAVSAIGGLSIYSTFSYVIPSAFVRTFALTRIVFNYLQRLLTHRESMNNLTSIRLRFFDLTAIRYPQIKSKVGELVDRLQNDAEQVSMQLIRVVSPLVCFSFTTLTCSIALWFVEPIISLSMVVLIGVVLGYYWLIYQDFSKIEINTTLKSGTMRDELLFSQNAWLEIQTLGAADKVQAQLQKDLQTFSQQKKQKAVHENNLTLVVQLILLAFFMFATLYILFVKPVSAPICVLTILSFIGLSTLSSALPTAALEASRIKQAATRLELTDLAEESKTQPFSVEFDDVLKIADYQMPQTAIARKQTIAFTAKVGVPTLILGTSGTGKTTFLRHLAQQLGLVARFVTTNDYVFTGTIADNLQIGQTLSTKTMLAGLKAVGLDDFSLDELIGESGRNLSGGERARLTILRAILSQAPIIILDEPLAELDGATRFKLLELLKRVSQERILLVCEHDVDSVRAQLQPLNEVEFLARVFDL